MTLDAIRKKLDSIDRKIVHLVAERQSYMKVVRVYKKKNQMASYQPKREKEIMKSKEEMAKELEVDASLIKKIFTLIFKNSRKLQRESK